MDPPDVPDIDLMEQVERPRTCYRPTGCSRICLHDKPIFAGASTRHAKLVVSYGLRHLGPCKVQCLRPRTQTGGLCPALHKHRVCAAITPRYMHKCSAAHSGERRPALSSPLTRHCFPPDASRHTVCCVDIKLPGDENRRGLTCCSPARAVA